jgi:hypothetical protein
MTWLCQQWTKGSGSHIKKILNTHKPPWSCSCSSLSLSLSLLSRWARTRERLCVCVCVVVVIGRCCCFFAFEANVINYLYWHFRLTRSLFLLLEHSNNGIHCCSKGSEGCSRPDGGRGTCKRKFRWKEKATVFCSRSTSWNDDKTLKKLRLLLSFFIYQKQEKALVAGPLRPVHVERPFFFSSSFCKWSERQLERSSRIAC